MLTLMLTLMLPPCGTPQHPRAHPKPYTLSPLLTWTPALPSCLPYRPLERPSLMTHVGRCPFHWGGSRRFPLPQIDPHLSSCRAGPLCRAPAQRPGRTCGPPQVMRHLAREQSWSRPCVRHMEHGIRYSGMRAATPGNAPPLTASPSHLFSGATIPPWAL